MKTLYLAAGLFNAGARLHNLFLERELKKLGYDIILPQREALKFFDGKQFDVDGIVRACKQSCITPAHVCVACIDGADSDSGTAVEYGIMVAAIAAVIVGVVFAIGTQVDTAFETVNTELSGS